MNNKNLAMKEKESKYRRKVINFQGAPEGN